MQNLVHTDPVIGDLPQRGDPRRVPGIVELPGSADARRRYWRSNVRLIAVLIGVLFAVTFGIGYFARELDFSFFGWPFSFWMSSQGALAVYVAMVGYYAWTMNRRDRRFIEENQASAAGARGEARLEQ
jgi:putative solute:sodium symporter small subunit